MPLPPMLAEWLAGRGHDAVHAMSLGLDQASDAEIMTYARQESRTIISADLDYPRLLAIARTAEPGLILFRAGNWRNSEVTQRMAHLLASVTEADISRSILVVERNRLRRRRLPISG
jgi:predicted nuclease of predicted toxin-antitoxin system